MEIDASAPGEQASERDDQPWRHVYVAVADTGDEMTIITTRLTVAPDGTVSLSERVPPGEHQARVVVQPLPGDQAAVAPDLSWLPQFDIGGDWPPGMTFGRHEIYGDDGR